MYVPGPRLANWYEPLLAVTVVATGVVPPFLYKLIVTPPKPVSSAVMPLPVMSVYLVPLMQMFVKLSKLLPVEFCPLVRTNVYPPMPPVCVEPDGTTSCTLYVPGPRFVKLNEPFAAVTVVATGVLPPFLYRLMVTPPKPVSSAVKLLPVMSLYLVPLMVLVEK